ncbi:MAG TPA: cytochrome d ubiquinol oxidase subunit II [Terriglobia bacterium]|nr:cytochrome d ubiquinol oxidase subunit II [Terriglobia bacterium]
MSLNAIWFWALGGMLIAYSVLDGYDLGVGATYLWVARAEDERRTALNAIGPVWNGNEVWLLAAGGMLVVSFPRVYASAFSGFYLALILVLWFLILRGVSIEFRSKLESPLWRSLFDAGFWLGSLALALLLGVALGNVLRGLPVGADGTFQGTFALMLNPYALLTGLLSLATLAWHGANYLRLKTEDALQQRARAWAGGLYFVVLVLVVLATLATFWVSPTVASNYRRYPAAWAFPLLAVLGLSWGFRSRQAGRERWAFRGSVATIAGLLGAAAMTVYPNLLYSTLNPDYSLTIFNAASSQHALRAALLANVLGMIGVIVYTTYVHRTFSGKVHLGDHGY